MRKYELTAVFAGTISDTDVAALLSRVQTIITDVGATGVESSEMGKHRLSYPISGNEYGHIVHFMFDADPAIVAKLQQKLHLTKEVLRFVIELFVEARTKRTPQLADSPLIKASREREREERAERMSAERDERVPTFSAANTQAAEPQKMDEKPVDLEEIDKKLDQLLQGDLTPTV